MEHGFSPLNIVSEGEVHRIQEGILDVLKTTGVMVEDPDMLNLMGQAGCQIDASQKRARFPEDVVLGYLDFFPSKYVLKARDEANDLRVTSGGATYFMASSGTKLVDLKTGESREPTRKDFYDAVKILDYLEHVDLQTAFPYFGFAGVPGCMRVIESTAAKFRASSKAIKEGATGDEYLWTTAMAKAIGCDVMQVANSAAPFAFLKGFTDRLKYLSEQGMPMQLAPGPTRGFTSPVTVAGTAITNNAETIAAIVLSQMIKRGTRSLAVNMSLAPNMRNGLPGFGDIGNGLQDAAFNQIWRAYQIPCGTSSTSWTSSMTMDYQAGYELSMMALISALSGPSFIAVFSSLYAQNAASPVKSIVDNDVVGMIKRFCRGVEVTPETMAVNLINEVGPMPATFLRSKHTFKWWRNECYLTSVANQVYGPRWFRDSGKGTIDLAQEKMEHILESHQPLPLTDSQEQEIEYILKNARQYYRNKGMISDEEWDIYQKDINSSNYPYA
jgi:trimethylamine--corrinoid protein Co-methyltransferase